MARGCPETRVQWLSDSGKRLSAYGKHSTFYGKDPSAYGKYPSFYRKIQSLENFQCITSRNLQKTVLCSNANVTLTSHDQTPSLSLDLYTKKVK